MTANKGFPLPGNYLSVDIFPRIPLRCIKATLYDPAHRLISIADGQGNRIAYTLDNAGRKMGAD